MEYYLFGGYTDGETADEPSSVRLYEPILLKRSYSMTVSPDPPDPPDPALPPELPDDELRFLVT